VRSFVAYVVHNKFLVKKRFRKTNRKGNGFQGFSKKETTLFKKANPYGISYLLQRKRQAQLPHCAHKAK